MKCFVLVCMTVLLVSALAVGDTSNPFYYYSSGQQQPLLVNDSLISIKLVGSGRSSFAGLMSSSPVLVDTFHYFSISTEYWVLGIEPGFTYSQAAESLLANPDVANVNPVFYSRDSLTVFLIDDIIMQFEDGISQQ